jgi:hypothetical protein
MLEFETMREYYENIDGAVFSETDKKRMYAEDINKIINNILYLKQELDLIKEQLNP